MANLAWLDDDSLLSDLLLAEMTPEQRALFCRVSELGRGLTLLRLLELKANALLTAEDLAASLGRFPDTVEDELAVLIEAGLARRVHILDTDFYGPTDQPERRRLARELVHWQDRWQARLTRILRLLDGARAPRTPRLSHISPSPIHPMAPLAD